MSRFGLLDDRDFRNLWLSTTVSNFGSHVTVLALPLVAILVLHAGPAEIGVLVAMETLPFLVLGLPAGVWVDRMRRRPVLIAADLGRAVLLASITLAAVLHLLTLAQLYAVGFAVGILHVFFEVAYTSYLPSLVERDELVEGNAKLEGSRAVASVAGPGFAGYLLGLVGAAVAMLVDALSFVASAVFVWSIRRPEEAQERRHDGSAGMRAEIVAGLRWIGGHPILRVVLASNTLANVFLAMFQTLFVLYLVNDLGLTPATIGVVVAVANIGALVGAVVAGRISLWLGVGRAIALTLAAEGAGYAVVALTPPSSPLPMLLVGVTLLQFVSVVFVVNAVSLRQTVTPRELLGRMTATYRFASWGVIPLGSTLAGVLGSVIGIAPTLLVAAIGALLSALPILLSPVGSLQTLPPDAPSDAASSPASGPGVT